MCETIQEGQLEVHSHPADIARAWIEPSSLKRRFAMLEHILKLSRDETAATAVEYAVMLALVLVAIISTVNAVGNTSSGLWASDTNQISTAIGGS